MRKAICTIAVALAAAQFWTFTADAASTAPRPVRALKVTARTTSSIGLSWAKPKSGPFAGVVVRYAKGANPPSSPTGGRNLGKFGKATHAATAKKLSAATEYGFSIFAYSGSKYAKRVTITATTRPAPGSYRGTSPDNNNNTLTFYVAAKGTTLQDATSFVSLDCAPNSVVVNDYYTLANATIAANGSFTGSATQHGVIRVSGINYPARFSYALTGRFSGTTASGKFRETLTYNDGTAQTCTTDDLAWSATRDTQGTQTTTAPPTGSYHGTSPDNNNNTLTFYVAAKGTTLQDATSFVSLDCAPNSVVVNDYYTLANATIAANGSFTGSATQHGVIRVSGINYPATFSYVLTGHFHSVNNTGVERAAGTFRETLTYNDGTAQTCTTDDLAWSATRDTQGTQTTTAPPTGSYHGTSPDNNNNTLTFYVAAKGTTLQDATSFVSLDCAPNSVVVNDYYTLANATIAANGSFTGSATQHGVIRVSGINYPATFSYVLTGHFHSVNNTGVERAAGTFRETLTYNDGTAQTCTTDDLAWSATRDTQGTQTTTAPPTGSYHGTSPDNNNNTLTFDVSSDSTTINDVSTPDSLYCAPNSHVLTDSFVLSGVDIAADDSFNGSASQMGVVHVGSNDYAATYNYLFTGHFHALDSTGHERAAGTFRERITYNDGTAQTCTTDDLPWSATH